MENEVDIVCEDCGVTFVVVLHEERMDAMPTRCSMCRTRRVQSQAHQQTPKYTGDRNEYRSPMACEYPEAPQRGSSFRAGGRKRSHDNIHVRKPMFTAVCAKCGSTAYLPFQPSKFQEVYCRACHHEKRGLGRKPEES
ncbi:MAG: hypothetical protein BWY17_01360 [Deltaproteobacteria bacterium ADurb.Bin207]|jgi:CxxC-x17-CxxC domain-containing protein|nr:MAG: hypothetical protein BWY17_01360 [Deltaproteobacteria bacterium ADurb.Bin207]